MNTRRLLQPHRTLLAAVALAAILTGSAGQASGGASLDDYRAAEKKTVAMADRLVSATVGLGFRSEGARGSGHQNAGSGVIVSADGLILTAAHLIRSVEKEITVLLSDGRKARAMALGTHATDAGMAKIIDAGPWPHVELASTEAKPGDWCLAVGHTAGFRLDRKPPIRLGRVLNVGTKECCLSCAKIGTDATISLGDSGGPLFNLDGEVIGINSTIGTSVLDNRHVPARVFRKYRDEMAAGKHLGETAAKVAKEGSNPLSPEPKPGKEEVNQEMADAIKKQLLNRLLMRRPDIAGAEKKSMEALITDLVKRAKRGPNGAIRLELDPADSHRFTPLLEDLALAPAIVEGVQHGKSNPEVLEPLTTLAEPAAGSTVVLLVGGKPVGMGTVVDTSGHVVAKASELQGEIACRVGTETVPAELVASDPEHDLALVRVDAKGLTPIRWDDTQSTTPGRWLVVPDADGKPLALGVIAGPPRKTNKPMVLHLFAPESPAAHRGPGPFPPVADVALSKRRTDFPVFFAHDCAIQAHQCGTVLLNLDGKAVGLNIARANRTTSHAIPARTVQSVVAELLKQAATGPLEKGAPAKRNNRGTSAEAGRRST